MSLRSRFFAFTYDRFSKGSEEAGLAEMRRNLIAGASGDVLEIGGGTGANLGYYGVGVESVTVTEPEPSMLKRLERKAREQNSQATVLRAPAEDLPFEDASFDTVVSTLVLCGVDDQPRVVGELRPVCSGPAAGSSSSSTFARTTRAWQGPAGHLGYVEEVLLDSKADPEALLVRSKSTIVVPLSQILRVVSRQERVVVGAKVGIPRRAGVDLTVRTP